MYFDELRKEVYKMKRYRNENGQLTIGIEQLKKETAGESAAYYQVGKEYLFCSEMRIYTLKEISDLAHFESKDGHHLFIASNGLGTFLQDVAADGEELIEW